MAGVVAIYGPGAEKKVALAEIMMSRIRHRGPSFAKIFFHDNILLGYLGQNKKTDTGASKLPYVDSNRKIAITCDAEIYNPESFLAGGTNGETIDVKSAESIINALVDSEVPDEKTLNGPFSFVLNNNDSICAGRDRLGIAPLYMADKDGLTLFASELKAFRGLASNIREFPPGHIYVPPNGFHEYQKLEPVEPDVRDKELLCGRLQDMLRKSVENRLNCCDSKKGVFLSGGIDSSVIAALVSKCIPGVDSFTVGMENSEDMPFARMVADHLGTSHHEYVYNLEEVLDILPLVIYHLESFDAPLVRSAIANYIASREASKHVDTILIGEGGDEDFGGYHHVKRIKEPAEQQQAFVKLFRGLHNNGFMRTDRMNWAHSLNVRAPFFDSQVVALCLRIHPELKLYGEEQVEKWILRKAFENELPKEVVWRPKKQFARGSGSDDLLTRYAERHISDVEYDKEKKRYPNLDMRWKEEVMYFRFFRDHFGDDPETLATVGQWYE